MKAQKIVNAIGFIDDELISAAANSTKKVNNRIKWGYVAACFAVMLAVSIAFLPMIFDNKKPTPPPVGNEVYYKGYFYHVDSGRFSSYIGGKVIAEEKIGGKLEDVTITAGWKNAAGEWLSDELEHLHGEIYSINGISADIAVALKFTNKGEAITTTHYYVIMNPNADLTSVEEYIIPPLSQNNNGDE